MSDETVSAEEYAALVQAGRAKWGEAKSLGAELALTRAALANAEAQRDAKRLFVCEGCAFTFDAQHTNGDGSLSCPVCEIAAIEAQRDAACAEAASLRAVLSGKHDGRCADAKQGNGSGPCDCGSDAALATPSTAEHGGPMFRIDWTRALKLVRSTPADDSALREFGLRVARCCFLTEPLRDGELGALVDAVMRGAR